MEKDTEDKCYITFVFEWTEAVSATNAFEGSQFGPAFGAATGNLMRVNDILEEALREIANGTCDAEDIAQDALDQMQAHTVQQMNLHPRRRKIEEAEQREADERSQPAVTEV